ncbi:MAG TPA: HNH endonuclease signature motif containing protein [Blastocatellia bacterium]|nr:HNH endonuclease signature motif containing protein [Blastocatellia bacterium]
MKTSEKLAGRVAQRARYRCEYCHAPQNITAQTFHLDHIVPRSRGGPANYENLCLACPRCNQVRQDRTEAIDPRTKRRVRLFNPRTDLWEEHFRWSADYTRIFGKTPTGRATVAALKMNSAIIRQARQLWWLLDLIP